MATTMRRRTSTVIITRERERERERGRNLHRFDTKETTLTVMDWPADSIRYTRTISLSLSLSLSFRSLLCTLEGLKLFLGFPHQPTPVPVLSMGPNRTKSLPLFHTNREI